MTSTNSKINFGYVALDLARPALRRLMLAAGALSLVTIEVRCAVTWGNTGGNNDLAL